MDNLHPTVFSFSLYLSSEWLSRLQVPTVYCHYAQFSICQRFISVYCQSVFLSGVCATTDVGRTFHREFSRKGSANHSSKPKAQKNRLVFLLRFCQSPPSSRFSSVFVFIHLQQVFKPKHKRVSLYIPIQKILKTGK